MKQLGTGRLTAGIALAGIGLLLLLQSFWEIPASDWIRKGWPLALILLGVELLWHFTGGKEKTKLDGGMLSLAALVILGAILYTAIDPTDVFGNRHPAETSEMDETFTLPESVHTLAIDANITHLQIRGKDSGNRVAMYGFPPSRQSHPLKWKVEGGKALLRLRREEGWNRWRPDSSPREVTLELPAGRDLEIKLTRGNLRVEKMDGSLQIDQTHGDLSLHQLAGFTVVNHTNGNQHFTSIRGDLTANNVNGNIQIDDATGRVEASTVNGNIHAKASALGGDWHLHTVLGNVGITLPPGTNAFVEGETTLGDKRGSLFHHDRPEGMPAFGYRKIQLETFLGDLEADIR